jgi:hypothetical protein
MPTKEQAQKIATYFKQHHDELVLHGQVRHMPGFMDWNGEQTATDRGKYQSGGFWATPVGWPNRRVMTSNHGNGQIE